MSESGYYPPGAEHDPRAPWNQPEPVECPECHGSGQDQDETPGPGSHTPCSTCDGTGFVDPESIEDEGPDPDDLRDREFDRQMNGDY